MQAIQPFGLNAEYIRIQGNGNNALDFHIAYYIGKLSTEFPGSCFYIVSKDSGFDPLMISHLNHAKVACQRIASLASLPAFKTAPPVHEPLEVFIRYLQKCQASRPRTVKSLKSCIKAQFTAHPEVIEPLLERLESMGIVTITDGKVSYQLRDQPAPTRKVAPVKTLSAAQKKSGANNYQPALF